jgi:hypothetical protein
MFVNLSGFWRMAKYVRKPDRFLANLLVKAVWKTKGCLAKYVRKPVRFLADLLVKAV